MLTVTLLTALFILAALFMGATATAHRPGLHRAGTLETPLLHWRASLIRKTNAVRDAKCLRELRPRYPGGTIPRGLRRYAIVQWLGYHLKAQAEPSVCDPWPAWWERQALCVHAGEGSWTANTGNGYYGGMQMDMSFQRSYGPEFLAQYGTADNWPIYAQLLASWRAYSSGRGWHPWPTTARNCGLL